MAKQKLCIGKLTLGANLGVPGRVLPWLSPVQSLTAQQQCPDRHTNHTDNGWLHFLGAGEEKAIPKASGQPHTTHKIQGIQRGIAAGTSLSTPCQCWDVTSEGSFSPVNCPNSHTQELSVALISTAVSKHPPSAALDSTGLVCETGHSLSISSSYTWLLPRL